MSKFLICAWGSIINDPRNIKLASDEWFMAEGLELHIDYLRCSRDQRMTLVVDPSMYGTKVKPYLNWLDVDCIEEAIQMLYDRETAPNSKLGVRDVVYAQTRNPKGVNGQVTWPYGIRGPKGKDFVDHAMRRQNELAAFYADDITKMLRAMKADGIVFTALPRNWDPSGRLGIVQTIVNKIAGSDDEAFLRAVRYIVSTPTNIRTAIRNAVDWNEVFRKACQGEVSWAKEYVYSSFIETAGKSEVNRELKTGDLQTLIRSARGSQTR